MGIETILTILILAVAGVWAGRRIWRTLSRRATLDPDNPACGSGCGHCPIGAELGSEPGGPCAGPDRPDAAEARLAGHATTDGDEPGDRS